MLSFFITMATSASFHGVVGLQNGSRYQIDKKNYWRCDGFIATLEMGDIRVIVFTFGANAASVEDSMDARTIVGPIIDDDGKSAHSLHLFANDRNRRDRDSRIVGKVMDIMTWHSHIESHHSNLDHGDLQFTAFVDRISDHRILVDPTGVPPHLLDFKQNCIPSSQCIQKPLHSLHQLFVT
ncbi:hypothetical protein BDR07DRAFT_1418454 [Suillus spraguei]|nr:hypothetical protein BDR07DRAFT_1418454 [Suillus spraguei]